MTTTTSRPFDQEKALAAYTELMRRISVGAYQEREPDGSYGEDGVELSINNLNYQAESRGLHFVHQGQWQLLPMTDEEKGLRWHALLGSAIDTAHDRIAKDMPYVTVEGTRPYQYHFDSDRWYINVDVKHDDPDQGAATVLCRVSYDPETGFLQARRVTLAEIA
jgi:hypothetical protein